MDSVRGQCASLFSPVCVVRCSHPQAAFASPPLPVPLPEVGEHIVPVTSPLRQFLRPHQDHIAQWRIFPQTGGKKKKKRKKGEIQFNINFSQSRLFSKDLFLHCMLGFLYYCDKILTLCWDIVHFRSTVPISETSVMHTVRCSSAEICHFFKGVLGTNF